VARLRGLTTTGRRPHWSCHRAGSARTTSNKYIRLVKEQQHTIILQGSLKSNSPVSNAVN